MCDARYIIWTGAENPSEISNYMLVESFLVVSGYYNNEEETSRTIDDKGWMHTGDIGYIDDDGDVFIVDRIKELIKYKGFQVKTLHKLCLINRSSRTEKSRIQMVIKQDLYKVTNVFDFYTGCSGRVRGNPPYSSLD